MAISNLVSGVLGPPLQGEEEGREGKEQPMQGEQRDKADPKVILEQEYSCGGQGRTGARECCIM